MKTIKKIKEAMKRLRPFVDAHGQVPCLNGCNEKEFFDYIVLRGKLKYAREVVKKIDEELRGSYFLVKKGHDERIQAEIDILEKLKKEIQG